MGNKHVNSEKLDRTNEIKIKTESKIEIEKTVKKNDTRYEIRMYFGLLRHSDLRFERFRPTDFTMGFLIQLGCPLFSLGKSIGEVD